MIRDGADSARFHFYEFFAGAGMARLGLNERWDCVWANDNDPKKVAIYEHNFGPDHLDPRDVATIADEISAHCGGEPAEQANLPSGAEMAWASFPCQDLSLAGWQKGMSAGRSGVYWAFWKTMHALRNEGRMPPIIVIENVKGLLYGDSFVGLCESLAALGMRFGAFLADAKHFVPQSRPRVFFIAVEEHIDLVGFVGSRAPENSWFPKAVTRAATQLPRGLQDRWLWWNVGPGQGEPPSVDGLFELVPDDVQYHTTEQTERLLALMEPRHLEKVEAAKRAGGRQVGFLYKRTRKGQQRAEVRFDGVAGCLRTPKGGSSRQTVIVVEDGKVRSRLLSRIEAARLMGIPLDAAGRLPGAERAFFPEQFTYNDAYMAMGDGVAVPVVAHLASEVLSPLAERCIEAREETRSVPAPMKAQRLAPFLAGVDQRIADWAGSAP